ncbi:hypothetical protein [Rhizobium sp. J15]|uniref:hypothetical protein n=1 Tax=Rhizobium sp. J15 TaxID=2035450 RepID=UPI001142113A|nr:hypothetical protein [Rhizobium sp. J15]
MNRVVLAAIFFIPMNMLLAADLIQPSGVTIRNPRCHISGGKEYCRIYGSANCDRYERHDVWYPKPLPAGKKAISGTGRAKQTEVRNTGSVRFMGAWNNPQRKRSEMGCKFYCNAGWDDSFVYGYCQIEVEQWQ